MECIAFVADKLKNLLFDIAIQKISYMLNCSEYVETCKDEYEKLTKLEKMLNDRINDAEIRAETPGEDMTSWIKKAGEELHKAKTFIDEEAKADTTCCNLDTLYHYGKRATIISSYLLKHRNEGQQYKNCNFNPLPTPRNQDLHQRLNLENTQKSTLDDIICAIETEDIQIVGVSGFGGVGKTTIVREVAEVMKNKFDYIEFIKVSNSEVTHTEQLNKKAEKAAKRVKDGKKVLIILDDVWKELKLDELGIPCVSKFKKCKIIITSRNAEVMRQNMNAQKVIRVKPLEDEEAWTLFKRVVDISKWDKKLKDVGWEIVQKSRGLPLFVELFGKALKGKEFNRWETALQQLKAPIVGHDIRKSGLQKLKLSYDYLDDEVAKKCFLLCSMFPKDGAIGLKRLTHYGLALEIFKNLDSIQDAISKVQSVVDSLTNSSLLQPVKQFNFYKVSREGEEEEFTMHDLVRDMALFVKDNEGSWVRSAGIGSSEYWQPNKHHKSYQKISLIGNRIQELRGHQILFSDLDTFLIQDNFLSLVPDEFFRGMEKLKVLDMSDNPVSTLPQSLKFLEVLHTLYLSGNKFVCEISVLGELKCLEILMLRGTGITNIPEEIGKLTYLRLLDVDYCPDLYSVTPGVISNLMLLEEFYIGMGNWDCDDFVGELSKLQSPKVMHLKVPSLKNFPKDFRFETLIEFHIKDNIQWLSKTRGCKRILEISQHSFPLTMPIMKLIEESEMLNLWKIKDFDNILPYLYEAGFKKTRYIDLMDCENVKSLVMKTSDMDGLCQRKRNMKIFSRLEVIALRNLASFQFLWDSPRNTIFGNLTTIYITGCPSLSELFPLSVAQGLVNLRDMNIDDCKSLVVVISSDSETSGSREIQLVQTDIIFQELNNICFSKLPKLESFYSGHSNIKYPSLKSVKVVDCPSMKRWSNGENDIPNIKFEHEGRSYCNINDYIGAQLEEINGESRMRDWDTRMRINGGIKIWTMLFQALFGSDSKDMESLLD